MKIDTTPIHGYNYSQIGNYGFTFAMLKGDKYLHTAFMCKDYLQDMFWSEHRNMECSVCGLNWKPGSLDVHQQRFRMALHGGNVQLHDHAPYLQEFVNYFDRAQGIAPTIVRTTDDPLLIVVEFDNAWTRCGPMLSALTSIIRVAGAYTGGDPMTYLDNAFKQAKPNAYGSMLGNMTPSYVNVEIGRLKTNLPRLRALLAGMKVEHKWEDLPSGPSAHCTGIMGFSKFPEVK